MISFQKRYSLAKCFMLPLYWYFSCLKSIFYFFSKLLFYKKPTVWTIKRKLWLCRHRQPSSFSETEVVTDSENVSESNTDGFSDGNNDGNTDNPGNDFDILRLRDSQHRFLNKNGATEKIATVCNEIKQRFQPDLTNTDDENVIWDLPIYIWFLHR